MGGLLCVLLVAAGPQDVRAAAGDRPALLELSRSGDEEVRAAAIAALCTFYPEDAERIHAFLLSPGPGRAQVLRQLRTKSLPPNVQAACARDARIGALARRLERARAWKLVRKPESFYRRARATARLGISAHQRAAFAGRFAQHPDRDTMLGLAFLMGDPDVSASERAGAHRMMQSITGRTLPPNARMWRGVALTVTRLPRNVVVVHTTANRRWWRYLLYGALR